MTTSEESLDNAPDIALTGYVYAGRLCLFGMAKTPFGPIPLSTRAKIGAELPDGPVDFNNIPEPAMPVVQAAHNDIIDKLQFETMRASAENIVERTRQGDQNAMAIVAVIKEAADKGSPRAKLAVDMIKEYISKHPRNDQVAVGEENFSTSIVRQVAQLTISKDPYGYAIGLATYLPNATHDIITIVMLANGPLLYNKKISEIAAAFGSEEESAVFLAGTQKKVRTPVNLDKHLRHVFDAGRCVGIARRIQGVRYDNVPVSTLSDRVAWELGE